MANIAKLMEDSVGVVWVMVVLTLCHIPFEVAACLIAFFISLALVRVGRF